MFADSTTNTALCRWSLLFLFLSSSVQIPLDGCPEIHMLRPSHLRMKPQPQKKEKNRPIAEPTITQEREKKEERKKKKYTTQRLTYGNFSHPST